MGDFTDRRHEIRSPRVLFARRFAELYEWAGNPTLRRVSTAANARMRPARAVGSAGNVSPQRISDWRAGRNVPARFESLLPVLLTLIDLAGKSGQAAGVPSQLRNIDEWQRLWQASDAWTAESGDSGADCPYPGLRSYHRADAELFFGRTRETGELSELVAGGGLIIVVGASGAGKSSLLHAGLVPAVAHPADEWAVASLTPGADPRAAMTEALGGPAAEWGCGLRRLLIVDQAEELFLCGHDEPARDEFLATLSRCAADARTAVVLAVRADFFARCLEYPVLQEALERRSYLLGPMRPDELAAAITGPADHVGLKLDSGLEELVITELSGLGEHSRRHSYDPGALPLLSHVMAQVWQQREGTRLTVGGYRKAGGVAGSVATTAEAAWNGLTEARRRVAKQLLLGMVSVGDDTPDARKRVTRAELLGRTADPAAAAAVLDTLADTRLVTADSDTVYLTHEIVLRAWPRLRSWIDEDRVGYLVRQRLDADATQWAAADHDPALLYRGQRLAAARQHGVEIPAAGAAFVAAAVAAESRTRRRSTMFRVGGAAAAVVVLLLAVTAYAQNRINVAMAQQRNDGIFHAVLAEADRVQADNPSLAAQLDLVAERLRPGDPAAVSRLLETGGEPLVHRVPGHTTTVTNLAYRDARHLVATAGLDGTVRLWDVADPARTHEIGAPLTLPGVVQGLALSPDATVLAAVSVDGSARLWDIRDPRTPRPVGQVPAVGVANAPATLAFSPDGRTLAVSDRTGEITLWGVGDPASPVRLGVPLHTSQTRIVTVAFSPDGRVLAAGDDELSGAGLGTVDLWDVSNPDAALALPSLPLDPARTVYQVEFGPDGATLAVATNPGGAQSVWAIGSGTVQLWDMRDPSRPSPLAEPLATAAGSVQMAVAFSPDGRELATADLAGARVWNISDPARPLAVASLLADPENTCPQPGLLCSSGGEALAFAGDGRTVFVGGTQGPLYVWSLPAVQITGAPGFPGAVFTSADGDRMGTSIIGLTDDVGGSSPSVLWDSAGGTLRRLAVLAPGPDLRDEYQPYLSADGRTFLTMTPGDGERVRILDVADPNNIRTLAELPQPGALLSDDGTLLVTLVNGNALQMWNSADRAHPVPIGQPVPVAHPGDAVGARFVRSTHLVLTMDYGPADKDLTLWDARDPARMTRLSEIPGRSPLAVTPDLRTMVVSGIGAAQVWDISDPAKPVTLGNPIPIPGRTDDLDFSPDGRTLAMSAEGLGIQLWDMTDRSHPRRLGDSIARRGPVNWSMAFVPHTQILAAAADDGTVTMLDLNVDHAIARICALTAAELTPQAWQEHVPQLGYAPPCADRS